MGLFGRFSIDGVALLKLGNKSLSRDAMEPVSASASSLQQPRQVFRSATRWGRSVIEWLSRDAFLAAAEVQSGVHSVPIGEFPGKQINCDFLLIASPATALLCHFHGAGPQGGEGSGYIASTFSQHVPAAEM